MSSVARTKDDGAVQELDSSSSLIPSEVIDEASQRTFAVSIFVLIQAWKLFDLITLKIGDTLPSGGGMSSFSFVVKYVLLDGIYILTLLVLKISGLSFGPFRALLYSLLLFLLSLVGISNSVMPLGNTFVLSMAKLLRGHKELTIAGERIVPENAIDLDSHFKGKYTIHFLPDASARMNPFEFNLLCLDGSGAVLNMPIEFNTTSAIGSLQVQRITPDNKVVLLNYTKSDISKFLKKDYTHLRRYPKYRADGDRIFYLEYPIYAPGTYTIKSVVDENGISIRTYKSAFKVANCPSVEFIRPPKFDVDKNFRCLNDAIPQPLSLPLVKVNAVFPAIVKYVTTLNGRPHHKFETRVESETDSSLVNSYTRNFLEQEIYRHPEILAKAEPGVIEFHLSEIIDSLGISRKFNPALKDSSVWHKLFLKGSIALRLVDKNPQQDLIANGDKTLFLETLRIDDSEFPLSVTIEYDGKGSDILLHNITKLFKTKDELAKGVKVKSEGKYNIVSALSKYCGCKFSKTQYVTLTLAEQPLVQISASPVTDACIGTLGFIFDFEFTGKAPFQIDYQVFRNVSGTLSPVYDSSGSSVRHLKTGFKFYKFEYKPEAEGNFVVKFSKLKDMNYFANPIPLPDNYIYETYFKKKSQVSFYKSGHKLSVIRTCYGDSVQVPLYFSGKGPFSFSYSLVNVQTGEKLIKSQSVSDVTDQFVIQTPKLIKNARYKVEITQPIDGASCGVVMHSSDSMIIESRGEIPKVSIAEELKIVKIVEGDTYRIPLDFQTSAGRQSSDLLTFKHVDLIDSNKVSVESLKSFDSLTVRKQGTYSLESFKNGGCPGEIAYPKRSITVVYYERPSLSVVAEDVTSTAIPGLLELRKVCQTGAKSAQLKFSGSPPFVVDYNVKLPNGKVETGSLTWDKEIMDIKLLTDQFGVFEHSFTGIFDSHYTKQKQRTRHETITIRYEVLSNPQSEFAKSNNFLQICESNLKQNKLVLPVSFPRGDAPFKLSFKLDDQKEFTVSDITGDTVDIDSYVPHLDVGEHIIQMTRLVDSNGCSSSKFSPDNVYVIHITETPDVTKVGPKTDYCVGDHVFYNLTGVGPFTVFYRFRDVLQKAEVLHTFRRLAAKAGTLEIEAITDSSSGSCLVNFTETPKFEALKLRVHDLPSVEINQGDNIVENIHEGDQAEIKFTFKGTPPFRVKYVRTLEDKRSRKPAPVVETKEVGDIWDYEHTELVSLEGTYEAVEVYDAFCHAIKNYQRIV